MLHERCVHIVDDEAKVRDALTLLLSTAQIESNSYDSAEEYLTSNPLKEPACILLDNQLPGMSGIELLKHIVAAASDSAVIIKSQICNETHQPFERGARFRQSFLALT